MSDEKPGWMWQRIPAGIYGLSDKRGRRLMHVTPAATIEFASPGIAALIADAPAMLELLSSLEWTDGGRCPECGAEAQYADPALAAENLGAGYHGELCELGKMLDRHGRGRLRGLLDKHGRG